MTSQEKEKSESKIIIDPALRKFLEDEGVLEQFIRNFKEYALKGVIYISVKTFDFTTFESNGIPSFLLYLPTPEGIDFWNDILIKWMEFKAGKEVSK